MPPYFKVVLDSISQNSLSVVTERAQRIFQSIYVQLITGFVTALAFAYVLSDHVDHETLMVWLAIFVLVFFGRLILGYRFRRCKSRSNQIELSEKEVITWLNAYRVGSFFGGLAWGFAGWLFFEGTLTPRDNLILFALGGVCVGALVVMSIDLIALYLFYLGVWLPVLFKALSLEHTQYTNLPGTFVVLFVLTLIYFSYLLFNHLNENILLKLNAIQGERSVRSLLRQANLQFEQSPLPAIAFNLKHEITLVNDAAETLLGYKTDDLVGRSIDVLIPAGEQADFQLVLNKLDALYEKMSAAKFQPTGLMLDQDVSKFVQSAQKKDKKTVACEWHNAVMYDADGTVVGFTAVLQDITQRLAEQDKLVQDYMFANRLLGASILPVFVINPQHEVIVWNDACEILLGMPAEEMLGTKNHWKAFYEKPRPCLVDFIADGNQAQAVAHYEGGVHASELTRNGLAAEGWFNCFGSKRYFSINAAPVYDNDGKLVAVVESIQDSTRFKLAENEIYDLAFYDSLTNLPNRRLLMSKIAQLKQTHSKEQHVAFIFLDLDNFKNINDTLGHSAGDRVLIQAAQRLSATVRAEDTVVRLGGDEFVVAIAQLSDSPQMAQEQAELVAKKIIDALSRPFILLGSPVIATASLGVYVCKGQSVNEEEVMKNTDTAMYQAKEKGRNTYCIYDESLHINMQKRNSMLSDISLALINNEMTLHLQPQIQLLSNGEFSVYGAECLIRWCHPKIGMIPPYEFIPLAESSEVILNIGDWVMEQACGMLKNWASSSETKHLMLSVNVSPVQVRHPNFEERVLAAVKRTGINPELLTLEITETVMMQDMAEAAHKLSRLRDHGLRIAMDDFGTGYSSLGYLHKLPLNEIKIDKSFVDEVEVKVDVMHGIISMAKNLNIDVIAEGVETEAQRAILQLMGCHRYQGYFFSKPLPYANFMAYQSKISQENQWIKAQKEDVLAKN